MATTPRWTLPYPVGTDIPDVPLWMNQLAVALDNVAMDDQGTLAAIPAVGKRGRYYQVRGDARTELNGRIYRDNGVSWDEVKTVIPVVTTMPTTGLYDGFEVDYLADATKGVVWRFRYRSGSASAFKWEFVGGPPMPDNNGGGSGSSSTATYSDMGAAGPDVIAPLHGEYLLSINSQHKQSAKSAIYSSAQIGITGTTVAASDAWGIMSEGPDSHVVIAGVPRLITVPTTATLPCTIRWKGRSNGSALGEWGGQRKLSIIPVRVTEV